MTLSLLIDYLKFAGVIVAGVIAFGLIVVMVWGLVAEDEADPEDRSL